MAVFTAPPSCSTPAELPPTPQNPSLTQPGILSILDIDEVYLTYSNEDRVTAHLVSEVKKIIETQRTKHGESYAKIIEIQFITKYLTDLATQSLTKFMGVKGKGKSEYDLVAASFSEFKVLSQEAVASAFSAAMSQFTGKPVEYFCSLYPISEPLSKTQH